MKSNLTAAYTFFDHLAESSDFLDFLLNNINSCVLVLNKDMKLQAFNEPLRTIFVDKEEEHLLLKLCGEVIGCAFQVEEQQQCGETKHCNECILRISAIESYASKKPIIRQEFVREFYSADGTKQEKHLVFSVKPIYFRNDYYLIVLIEDITWLLKRYKPQKQLLESILNDPDNYIDDKWRKTDLPN
jgi:hypothetical protein